MRRIIRVALDGRTERYLARKQREVDVNKNSDVGRIWKSARETKSFQGVENTLRKMAGKRESCMYCSDSRGIDIEHFWPKAHFPQRTFLWANFLLTCAGCNREKKSQFEFDDQGDPLLINPAEADPWEYFEFDPRTGCITPRFNPATSLEDARAKYTLGVIDTLHCEACNEGRQRTYRNLSRAVRAFIANVGCDSNSRDELKQAIQDNDEYGLVAWFMTKEGQTEEPFCSLRKFHSELWNELQPA